MDKETVQKSFGDHYPGYLGIELADTEPDCVKGTLRVRPELCTVGGTLHGGAIMSLADTLGAVGTVLNLPENAGTTTVESKTNFMKPIPEGTTATAESRPLHRGKRLMVWQTSIYNEKGELAAQVTQTQIVLAS